MCTSVAERIRPSTSCFVASLPLSGLVFRIIPINSISVLATGSWERPVTSTFLFPFLFFFFLSFFFPFFSTRMLPSHGSPTSSATSVLRRPSEHCSITVKLLKVGIIRTVDISEKNLECRSRRAANGAYNNGPSGTTTTSSPWILFAIGLITMSCNTLKGSSVPLTGAGLFILDLSRVSAFTKASKERSS